MPWPSAKALVFLALVAEWWIPFMFCMLAEHRRERQRNFVVYWQRHFEENVSSKWIHYDGMGH